MTTEDLYKQIGYYSTLLEKYFEGTLSASERRELARWLWEDRRNRLLFQQIKYPFSLKSYDDIHRKIDPEKEYELLSERCPELREKRIRPGKAWYWAAAAVVLVLGAGLWFKYGSARGISEVEGQVEGKVFAVLKTSSGKVFHLSGHAAGEDRELSTGLHLRDSMKELICEDVLCRDSVAVHELIIPRGGEYKLILSDGTKVWLNSESVIRFPAVFPEHEREITLLGEAYLEVSPDTGRPFRIKADKGRVEVLGTSFGMTVYPAAQEWSVVLVGGSVKAIYEQQSLLLKPGMKASLVEHRLLERACDTEKELAWVDGLFVFRHDRLEDVVQKLSRWYDIDFAFEQEALKDYVFTGQVSRDLGIDQILGLIERMNVIKFEKKDGYVSIKEKSR